MARSGDFDAGPVSHHPSRHAPSVTHWRLPRQRGGTRAPARARAGLCSSDRYPMSEVRLGPLSTEDISRLCCDALRCEPVDVRALALAVRRRTGGNAFFVVEFLTSLAEERLLTFDRRKRAWTWDLDGIAGKGSTENLLDLMIGRLRRLPDATQEGLKLLAFFG